MDSRGGKTACLAVRSEFDSRHRRQILKNANVAEWLGSWLPPRLCRFDSCHSLQFLGISNCAEPVTRRHAVGYRLLRKVVMVDVAQLAEHRDVTPEDARSWLVIHPSIVRKLKG